MVIVGAGPVGVRVLRELRRRNPARSVILYGDEQHQPYNRTKLSGLLGGQHKVHDLALAADLLLRDCPLTEFRCRRVASIDTTAGTVTDGEGAVQPYSSLVLATGSRPFIPSLAGAGLAGVYTFRDMADAERLAARRVQSSHTVVLGAGLLGIEAARAMQRHNTRITLVDHNPYPMFRQLDATAGALLVEELEAAGIVLSLGTSLRMLMGTGRVEGVVLRNGDTLTCDTVILATGIRPNLDLARDAGLAYGRGITVNAQMRTSDPRIYAVGECCEFRGEVFGLVAPGYEQATIAARNIEGEETLYEGTQLATSLKVAGLPVFSLGDAHPPASMRSVTWQSDDAYRRISLAAGRIVGINAIGDWPELPALRDRAKRRRWIAPWQLWRFRRSGKLLSDDATGDVANWPAQTIICNCNAVSAGELRRAIAAGSTCLEALGARTQAGTGCGSCKPLILGLLGDSAPRTAGKASTALAALTLPAALLIAVGLTFSLPYPDTVQLHWDWGQLWRLESYKQWSGYSILGLCAASVLFSLRKRLRVLRVGNFDWWRLGHVVLTVLALVALGVHTGFRLGGQLNMLLSVTFLLLLLAGALLGAGIAWEHRLSPNRARQLRSLGLWSHVLLSWPLPALLGAHILKTYYF